jgi:hypothetical protein
MFKKLVE